MALSHVGKEVKMQWIEKKGYIEMDLYNPFLYDKKIIINRIICAKIKIRKKLFLIYYENAKTNQSCDSL